MIKTQWDARNISHSAPAHNTELLKRAREILTHAKASAGRSADNKAALQRIRAALEIRGVRD